MGSPLLEFHMCMLTKNQSARKGVREKFTCPKRQRTAMINIAVRRLNSEVLYQIGSGTQFLDLPTVALGTPTPEQTGLP